MADAVSACEATLVGDQLPGDYKWSDGVLAADGNIYGIPVHATQVLRFDPRTQKATLVGDELPGHWKWVGGVLAADGNIYGIPCNATQVLCFDPRTQQSTLVGDQLPGGDWKWWGGLAADGNIYGIPHNATQVLRFDPRTQQGKVPRAAQNRFQWGEWATSCRAAVGGAAACWRTTATSTASRSTPRRSRCCASPGL